MKKIILNTITRFIKLLWVDGMRCFFIPGDPAKAVQLAPEYHKGRLVFRLPGSSQRLSYKTVKAGLESKIITVYIPVFKFPF